MSHQHRKNISEYNVIRKAIKAQLLPFCGCMWWTDVCSFGVFVRKTRHWPRATDMEMTAI